jgi:hypothetical protein
MGEQKKQKTQLLISQKPPVVIKLLQSQVDASKSTDVNTSKAKKDTVLFYNKPIHKARKHDLF